MLKQTPILLCIMGSSVKPTVLNAIVTHLYNNDNCF